MIKKPLNEDTTGCEKEVKDPAKSRRLKKMIALVAIATGVGATTVASAIIAYSALFARYERPDYSLVAGDYCYDRVKERLSRSEFFFKSDKNKLKGYYYPSKAEKGLVVLVHGFKSGADNLLPVTEYLVNSGFNVFTYDGTGSFDSEGESRVGMCQALIDLDYALKYIKKTSPYKGQPIFLLGHSQGGYAVTSALSLHGDVKAVGAIAPMNDGGKILEEKGVQYAGQFAKIGKPAIDAYQKLLFGKYLEYNGVKGINSTSIPVFIAQGQDDDVILYDKQSVYAHREEITNPNVEYHLEKGLLGGHVTILNSIEAVVYQKQVLSDLDRLKEDNDGKSFNEKKREYLKTVNHSLYSGVNAELMDKIIKTFEKNLI